MHFHAKRLGCIKLNKTLKMLASVKGYGSTTFDYYEVSAFAYEMFSFAYGVLFTFFTANLEPDKMETLLRSDIIKILSSVRI